MAGIVLDRIEADRLQTQLEEATHPARPGREVQHRDRAWLPAAGRRTGLQAPGARGRHPAGTPHAPNPPRPTGRLPGSPRRRTPSPRPMPDSTTTGHPSAAGRPTSDGRKSRRSPDSLCIRGMPNRRALVVRITAGAPPSIARAPPGPPHARSGLPWRGPIALDRRLQDHLQHRPDLAAVDLHAGRGSTPGHP